MTRSIGYKEYQELLKKKKKNKYNARSTSVDGIHFPSLLEADVYRHLHFLKKNGDPIKEIEMQKAVFLTAARISYKTDFRVTGKNPTYWVEAKGVETETYRLKKKLWVHYGPGELHIYKRGHGPFNVYLVEIVYACAP